MPYKSLAQMRYMHSQLPNIAKKWDAKYETKKNLPEKLSFSKRKSPNKG